MPASATPDWMMSWLSVSAFTSATTLSKRAPNANLRAPNRSDGSTCTKRFGRS